MEFTVTVRTEAGEDPRQALAKLLGFSTDGKAAPAKSDQGGSSEWTSEEFTRFWSWLQKDAQKIVAEIATKPDGYPMGDLQKKLGWEGTGMAGRMSSVGFNVKLFANHANPVMRDWSARVYKMDPRAASWVKELAAGRKIA
jgi:hypothetical protein